MTPPSAHCCKLRLLAEAVPANARQALRRSVALSAVPAPAGLSLPGNRSWAIPMMACVIPRTFLSSLPTACGVTSTFSVGRTPRMAGLPVAPTRVHGLALVEPPSHLQSWRASKRLSTKRRAALRGIQLPFTISLRTQSMVRAEAAPVIRITEMPLARAAFSTT